MFCIMRKSHLNISFGLPLSVMLLLLAFPAMAAGPTISSVSPTTASSGVPVDFMATVSGSAGIQSCNLYVDLEDMGAMTVSGNVASKRYTFSAGGSRIAFVFCKDNAGGMASGPNTAIWVQGATVNTAPLTPSQTSSEPPVQPPAPEAPVVATTTQQTASDVRKLVKLACAEGALADDPCTAVYYIGADGKRHAYPNSKVFLTWYLDFDSVETVTPEELSAYPLGKNVTYRPGVRMVKFTTLAKVYAVGQGGLLRWITSEDAARATYGEDWNTKIDDLPDTVYTDYSFGGDIASSADYLASEEMSKAPTFD
jgi:hypothetical protein